jgi:hypothetical protein
MTTVHLELAELAASQSQPHVTINSSLQRLDNVIHLSVIAQTNTPPASPEPNEGDRYICGTAPTGDWAGHANDVAVFIGGTWEFFQPQTGWLAYVRVPNVSPVVPAMYMFDGAGSPQAWEVFSPPAGAAVLPDGNYGGVIVSSSGTVLTLVPIGIPQNAQTGNYGIVLADNGYHIYHASGAGAGDTYTLPANGTLALPIGFSVTFVNMATDSVAIAITSDTLNWSPSGSTGTRTLAQYGVATALKVTSTVWVIFGSGLT